MSLLEMQRALCRVLTDKEVRDAYLSNPGSALRIFDLSDAERECLIALDHKRLQRYADMLLINRLDLAFKALPRIRGCFWGEFLAQYSAEYGKKFPPVPVVDRSPMLKEVCCVKAFLDELISTRRIAIPAFENVLRYEMTMFLLANEPAVNDAAHAFEAKWISTKDQPAGANSVLVMTPAARIEAFDFDVLQQTESARESLDLPRLAAPIAVIFHRRANVRKVRVFRANSHTAALLRSCDGNSNVQTICDRLSLNWENDRAKALGKCLCAVNALQSSGLITCQ